jgi:hypothetical protein
MSGHWKVAPPDFVGVGAQRCGTTRWFDLISAHPGVHPGRKELHFFRHAWDAELDTGAYAELFPRPDGMVAGEWTPRYMYDFWVPELLARAAPRARLLVSLRDPVERWVSGVGHARRRNHTDHPAVWVPGQQVERGFYARQLQRLYRFFPREQVLVLQFERCVADPRAELSRTYRFLGLDPAFRPDLGARPETPLAVSPPEGVRRELVREYADDVAELCELVPELDLALWPNFS